MPEELGAGVTLHCGDSRDVLRELADASIDSCVTDPPYALVSITKRFGSPTAAPTKANEAYMRLAAGFMGRSWDTGATAFDPAFWAEVLRVLKPGGHLVAFGGTRSQHRLVCAIEDAGFEIRDQLGWVYGSGFPKSHDVSKGIDRAAGIERQKIARIRPDGRSTGSSGGWKNSGCDVSLTNGPPVTDAARQWDGWGTALKPSFEPILFGSKPVTVEQHFAIILSEITAILAEAVRWSNVGVSDAEKRLSDIQVRYAEAASSVLDGARMRSLESIGIARSAVLSSTFSALASIDLIRTRGCSALSHVRQNGSSDSTQDQPAPHGGADDILTRLMGMSTSVMMDGISQSTVALWLDTSEDLFCAANRFTTETATRATIALKILSCSLLPNISGGTGGLSPNWEPICLARKPLVGTVAANVLAHGTGALNVDGCRIGNGEARSTTSGGMGRKASPVYGQFARTEVEEFETTLGRWPANLCHDGSDEVLACFPETTSGDPGNSTRGNSKAFSGIGFSGLDKPLPLTGFGDSGSAARFFYCAKAGDRDRFDSKHPTVKPVALMRWLVRLVTPPGGLVLDPFAGSGTTGEAAWLEGFRAILVEREAEHQQDIRDRVESMQRPRDADPDQLDLFLAERPIPAQLTLSL